MKRDKRVTIMVTDKEYQHIQRRADLEKRSLSSHVWLMYRKGIMMDEGESDEGGTNRVSHSTGT
jgi:hypothetical protein